MEEEEEEDYDEDNEDDEPDEEEGIRKSLQLLFLIVLVQNSYLVFLKISSYRLHMHLAYYLVYIL